MVQEAAVVAEEEEEDEVVVVAGDLEAVVEDLEVAVHGEEDALEVVVVREVLGDALATAHGEGPQLELAGGPGLIAGATGLQLTTSLRTIGHIRCHRIPTSVFPTTTTSGIPFRPNSIKPAPVTCPTEAALETSPLFDAMQTVEFPIPFSLVHSRDNLPLEIFTFKN